MTIKYEIIISPSEEDYCFVAEMPEIRGCMADVKTYDECMKSFEVIASEWI